MKKASSLRMLAFFMACLVVVTTCFTVSISAIWDYDDEGTGMPAPDDDAQGLPYPDANDEYAITEYQFKYTPSILDAESQAVLNSAKAGDVVLIKIAISDIDLENKPLGMSAFQGTVTYNVEDISLFLNCDEAYFADWFANCIKFTPDEGMSPLSSITVNKNVCWTYDNLPPDWYPEEEAGFGLHWSFNIDKNTAGANGVMTDDCLQLIFPVKIAEDVEEGTEYTFTVPFPVYENMGTEYVKSGDSSALYASGGAYTITIKNHADIDANIATDAVYSAVLSGYDLGEKGAGILNDKLIPLTEKSKYEVFEGDAAIGMDFAAPVDVNGVTVTFNATAATELPECIDVYGVDANGGYTLLGTQTVGTAFDEGFAFNSGFVLETDTTVNAANAYQYTVSGFDVETYTGIYVEATAADNSAIAIGEIEVNGEYTKFGVTVENGTVAEPSEDGRYYPGTEIEITADQLADKIFIGWEVEGEGKIADSTSNTTTFTVGNSDAVVKAVYEDVLYGLEVQNGTGSGEYAVGTVVDIVANPAEYGKVFVRWEVMSGDAVIADPNSATTTVTTASGSSVIAAVYEDAPRYSVTVDYGSIATEPDEGFTGYLEGTVVTLVPPTANELPEGKIFVGWMTLCGSGTLDSANNTFTVGTGDAEIFAKLVDIHKPVPDNLAPDSWFKFTVGTPDVSTIGDDLGPINGYEGWYKGGYLNDQLYPLLAEGKWVPVTSSGNKFAIMAMLDRHTAYDIHSAAVTVSYVVNSMQGIPPVGVKLYGAIDGSGVYKTLLGELNANQMQSTNNFITFDEDYGLTSIAARYVIEVDPTLIDSYAYLIFEFDCMSICTNYRVGELEIYGAESSFDVSIVNGTMSPEASEEGFKYEDVITITADEIADKVFVGWTIEGIDYIIADASAATTTVTVGRSDAVITANYRDALYTLTVNNGSGDGDYVRGSDVTVVADTATDPELVFDKWIVVSGSATIADPANATTTVTTDGEAVIEATYKKRVYDLTVENGTGSGTFEKGTVVDITANEAPADMVFSHWTIVTGSGTLEDANSASTKFTTSNEATTLRAVYVDVLYKLEIQGGKATTDVDLNGLVVGTKVEIEAIVPDHKAFVRWEIVSGAGSFADATSANTTFTTGSGDTVIKAVFEDVKYDLTIENGTGSGEYVYDTVVDITANIPEGYLFDSWVIVEGEVEIAEATSANTTVTIKGDATVKATFVEKEYTVDVINGKVDEADKADSYKKGTEITIIADDAEANKHFVGWTIVEGDATIADATSAETTITVGSTNVVIRAEYADDLYSVTVENGTATGIEEGGNKVGDVITIVADDAAENMHFIGWTIVSGEATIADATSANTTVTVLASDVVIRAEYADDLYTITVENGTATGINEEGNKVGDVITIVADEAPEGKEFDKWVIVSGEGTIADENSAETTFTLGAGNTVIKATYKDIVPTPGTGDAGVAAFALFAVAGLIGTAVILKKKKD